MTAARPDADGATASPARGAAPAPAALDEILRAAVSEAAACLERGELVAFPTETVYGLGARADDDTAVARIYAAKGRPPDHPLIVHVLDAADAQPFTCRWPDVAERLTRAFWPGPLTVIVPRAAGVATAAAGGQASIGLRSPAHPVARALLAQARTLGVPGVAAPSANRFGRLSPTRAAHVAQEFGDDLLVLDGGDCAVGIESSIVDCTRERPVLLRPGGVSRPALEAAAGLALAGGAGEVAADAALSGETPRASGTLASHYAPRARLRLMPAPMLRAALELLGGASPSAGRLAVYSRTVAPYPGVRFRDMPASAAQAAHELFAALRELDAAGVELIWVEAPPDGADWDAVRDRLVRAAA